MGFDNLRWIDLSEPTEEEMTAVAERVGIGLRDLKESADPEERPRMDELEHYTAVVFKAPYHEKRELTTRSLGFFVSDKLLVTIHRERSEPLDKLIASEGKLIGTFRKGATTLMVRIIEEETREYFRVLDKVEEEIDRIEDVVFKDPQKQTVQRIFKLKKTLIYFHKALTADMDVIYKLEKDPGDRINREQAVAIRYVHDDLLQMIDMVATYRDLLTGALDIYLSSVSNNMNAIMKRMTAWASIVLIPTFITGLYGMNFTHMPEIAWQYGYAFAWALIIGSVLVLIAFFKKKDWF